MFTLLITYPYTTRAQTQRWEWTRSRKRWRKKNKTGTHSIRRNPHFEQKHLTDMAGKEWRELEQRTRTRYSSVENNFPISTFLTRSTCWCVAFSFVSDHSSVCWSLHGLSTGETLSPPSYSSHACFISCWLGSQGQIISRSPRPESNLMASPSGCF